MREYGRAMRRSGLVLGLIAIVAAGCATARPLHGADYLPLDQNHLWLFEGEEDGERVVLGIRVLGPAANGAGTRVRMEYQPGGANDFVAGFEDGFLVQALMGRSQHVKQPDLGQHVGGGCGRCIERPLQKFGQQLAGLIPAGGQFR